MIDDRTPYLDLPLPHPNNLLSEDASRLRQAMVTIDANIAVHDATIAEHHAVIAEQSSLLLATAQSFDARFKRQRLRSFYHMDF